MIPRSRNLRPTLFDRFRVYYQKKKKERSNHPVVVDARPAMPFGLHCDGNNSTDDRENSSKSCGSSIVCHITS